jgi:hypothetical protein
LKILLLHVPSFNNTYRPIGDFIWLNYMPMGLVALAAEVSARGLRCEIVHLGVEWALDRSFRVESLVADPDIGAVGVTLHWHHQSFDAIEVARAIKRVRPDIYTFLGGDTASFFHEEIVRDFPVIDAVVRGHAEHPLPRLLEAVRNRAFPETLENVTFRRGEKIVAGELVCRTTTESLDHLDYTAFHLIRHHETYIRDFGLPFFHAKRFSLEQNRRLFSLGTPMFPVPIGRGCPFSCTWCAGSHHSQKRHVSGMKGFCYRSHDRVIDSVVRAWEAGYGLMQSAMDPEPASPDYFVELFARLAPLRLPVSWMFECNGLPTTGFLQAFRKAFPDPDSLVALSPECGNEKMRLAHKGPGFTNEALFSKLAEMDDLNVPVELFFHLRAAGGQHARAHGNRPPAENHPAPLQVCARHPYLVGGNGTRSPLAPGTGPLQYRY